MRTTERVLLIGVSVALMSLSGCGGSSNSPSIPSTTSQSASPSATSPSDGSPTTEASEGTVDGVPPTDGTDVSVSFSRAAESMFGETPAFSSSRTFDVEGFGPAVTVTVYGANGATVQRYLRKAEFTFEIKPEGALVPVDGVEGSDGDQPEEDMPDPSDPLRLLDDPASSNLYIEFSLTDAAAEQMPTGVLVATVDPNVPYGAYHNFYVKDPGIEANNTVYVSMKVSSGEASGWLYLNCRTAGWMRVTDQDPKARELRATGFGKFDFQVYGRRNSSSTYQLTGWWSYSYLHTLPKETQLHITC